MKRAWRIICSVIALVALGLCSAYASNPQHTQNSRNATLDELTFQQMLYSVPINSEQEKNLIKQIQENEGKRYLRKHYPQDGPVNVETFRNKEILLITIPASVLFDPNSADLSEKAANYLKPLLRYLKDPDMYRMLLTMHTDNTGSDEYREQLTQDRVDTIFDWFEESGRDTCFIFPYSFSDDDPLKPNDTMDNRAANRRLEIYLMPGEKMVSQAKKGRISF